MRSEYYLLKDRRCVGGRKNGIFFAFLLLSLAMCGYLFGQELDDEADLVVWDGMEEKSAWHIEGKGNISLAAEYATEGRSSLAISGNSNGPVVIVKENTYLDLSFAKKIVFDVYNSGAPCQVAVALYAGARYESIPKELNSGLNKNVTFEFNAKDFKFILASENIAQIVELIVYPQDDKVEPFYIDNIRIGKLGGLASYPSGISPTMRAVIDEGFTPIEITPTYTGAYSVAAFPHDSPINVICEPNTLFLLGAGVAGLFIRKKKGLKK